ncbi:MAG: site-2 protease family protein [Candidatus Micrarchaeia archaeon]
MQRGKHFSHTRTINLIIVLATVFSIYLLWISNINVIAKWVAALIALSVSSEAIMYLNQFKGYFIFYMLATRKMFLKFIDNISKKHKKFWLFFAEWGLAVGFGALAYYMFKKRIGKKTIATSLVTIFVLIYVMLPYSALALNLINIPNMNTQLAAQASSSTPATEMLTTVIYMAASIIGGLATLIYILIVYGAAHVLYTLAMFAHSVQVGAPNTKILSTQIAYVYPVIPGIDMPLIAGIIALVIVLVVHEFSHGILARIAKIRLKSIGLLMFGLIPVGAFVEPDEKEVMKKNSMVQDRILAAGISANILVTIILFVVLIPLLFVLPSFMSTRVVVTGTVAGAPAHVVPLNAQIITWNNYKVDNISDAEKAAATDKPGGVVTLGTSAGNFTLIANSTGKIGIYVEQISTPVQGSFSSEAVNFAYEVVVLAFILNLLVAMVNLLPIPGFDGWRIYELEIKNKKLVTAATALILISLMISVLPIFWQY